MPSLRTWMLQHPRDWDDAARQQYAEDCTVTMAQVCAVQLQHVGPMTCIGMLLAVVRSIVHANPDIADAAMDAMLDLAAHIAREVPLDEGRTLN